MWLKLRQLWFYNRKEIKLGLGSLLSLLGFILLVNNFSIWIIKSLFGGAMLGGGVKLLFDL